MIIIFMRWSKLDRIDHVMLSNSICDLLCCVFIFINDLVEFKRFTDVTTLEQFMEYVPTKLSKITETIVFLLLYVSGAHTIAIAIERIFAVRFPTKYYVFNSFKAKLITLILVWFIPGIFVLSLYTVSSRGLVVVDYIKNTVLMAMGGIIFITYVYIVALLLFKRCNNQRNFNSQDGRLVRLTIVCLFIGGSYIGFVTPFAIYVYDHSLYLDEANLIILFIPLSNPFIYFIKVFVEIRQARPRGAG